MIQTSDIRHQKSEAWRLRLALASVFCLLTSSSWAQTPQPDWMQYRGAEREVVADSLNRPHMDAPAIQHWVSSAVADIMSFGAPQIDAHFREARAQFSDSGWTDFGVYMNQSGLLGTAKSKNYYISSIVNSEPRLVTSGVVSGAYRWYFEMPMMISFFPIKPDGETSTEAVATGRFTVQTQVGRHEINIPNGGLKIESWNVTAAR